MQADLVQILSMVELYFKGLHYGDAGTLETLFHQDCVLKAPGQRRSISTWLNDVAKRSVPAHNNHPWEYRVLGVELMSEQAVVKLNCPLPHGHFIDYLGLLKEQGEWKIVNKMYANNSATYCLQSKAPQINQSSNVTNP
ncbi:MAG: hypothetical protein CMK83_07195 [Pseudomonadales bacterium]|jgi:hypothetical protein|uniref:nuclear transport factor 2 family protein n=1 Tax=unclassified Ketobacter TaxID=2639109 RepID=UPI000C8A007F|nr:MULTISPECIES: nuclear transport factor 2 family protein [unclassified Ketobacter]MAQ23991.1 hypothetical protein [Pseudomonadales bacterium]MEC8813839.1 nuclear transport factor 2 family protein [Pseudomonadota bacterium]TNC88500.1 MAG: hypothetical protein CSH49_11360 [Alcanivorax sp.]HAG95814.1 nuclear transport factor 2 family protein [Gammaproteobacteria bacterium]RLT87842.1 MAG: nuclear transport factor 2 family protein [Ketobacter sp. GenoA1]|tara:strand:+ start:152 stop:568 length:417 start_codon:yes stop_codon:yes gene_type:complete